MERLLSEQDHSGWRLTAEGKHPSSSTHWHFYRNLHTKGMLVLCQGAFVSLQFADCSGKESPSSNQSLRIRSTKCIRENLPPQQSKVPWGLCSPTCFRGFMKQFSKRAGLQRALKHPVTGTPHPPPHTPQHKYEVKQILRL